MLLLETRFGCRDLFLARGCGGVQRRCLCDGPIDSGGCCQLVGAVLSRVLVRWSLVVRWSLERSEEVETRLECVLPTPPIKRHFELLFGCHSKPNFSPTTHPTFHQSISLLARLVPL